MDRHEWTDEEGETWEVDRAKAPSGAHLTLRYAPSLHTLAREILRLAEEVERLKAEAADLRGARRIFDNLTGTPEAAERARIRRELLAELMHQHQGKMPLWVFDDIAESIRRICPGEG